MTLDRRTVARAILNRTPAVTSSRWEGTVVSTAPLRVKVGTAIVDATPDFLMRGLTVDDAVWGETTNGRSVILGRFGGERDFGNDLSSFDPFAGWQVDAFLARSRGGIVMCSFTFTRTGNEITVPANGDLQPNSDVLKIQEISLRPLVGTAWTSAGTGPLAGGYVTTTGTVGLAAVAPGVTIPAGRTFSGAATWLIP